MRKQIGALAKPDAIQFAPTLPKTRSGKIMRRILRKISAGAFSLSSRSGSGTRFAGNRCWRREEVQTRGLGCALALSHFLVWTGETDTSKFGDTSTLSEPAVVAELIKGRKAV